MDLLFYGLVSITISGMPLFYGGILWSQSWFPVCFKRLAVGFCLIIGIIVVQVWFPVGYGLVTGLTPVGVNLIMVGFVRCDGRVLVYRKMYSRIGCFTMGFVA